MADVRTVGKRLVELCKAGKNLQAIDELYSPNIVSLEAHGDSQMPARMEGTKAIKGKNEWWFSNHTIHSADASGPWFNGDRFVVYFKMDITSGAGPMVGQRMEIEEAGVYTVKDGKIVQEEFFYDMGG